MRRALENDFLVFLSPAAQHAQNFFGVFVHVTAQATQCAVDLVLGMLPNAAGIEKDDVRLVGRIDQPVPLASQRANHQFAV